MMTYMRRLAGKVLALWLVSSLSLALQPCCEVVASSLPHGDSELAAEPHGTHNSHEHVTEQPSRNGTRSHEISAHGHCDSNTTGSSLYLDAQPTVTQARYAYSNPPAMGFIFLESVIILTRVILDFSHAAHPPPSPGQHTYLVTQRFRV